MKRTVKIILAVVAVVATLFGFSLLTGCTKEPNITVVMPTTTVEVLSTEAVITPSTSIAYFSDEDLYVQDVTNQTDLEYGMDDSTIIDYGYTICTYLASGGTGGEVAAVIAQSAIDNGLTADIAGQFGTMAVLAVTYLCPEYTSQIRIGLQG
jgi:hypothetical protein